MDDFHYDATAHAATAGRRRYTATAHAATAGRRRYNQRMRKKVQKASSKRKSPRRGLFGQQQENRGYSSIISSPQPSRRYPSLPPIWP